MPYFFKGYHVAENSVKTQKFILKLFPEIMVKGASAKKQMVNQLYQNLISLLKPIDDAIVIKKFSDKIEVVTPIEKVGAVREILLNTPGIEQVLEALQFDRTDTLEAIKKTVAQTVAKEVAGKSFVVRAKRTGTHPFNSSEIERVVGGYMLAHTDAKKVDLHNPDVTVRIELINQQLNIITAKYEGPKFSALHTKATWGSHSND